MPRSATFAVRLAALAAGAIALYSVAVLPYRGNLALHAIEQSSLAARAAADPQLSAIAARRNLDDLDRIAAGSRLDPAWYMLYGANCELLNRLPEAAEAYTRALRVDDRPELYVNRANVRLHLGQTEAAIADLAHAARFNPTVLDHLDGDLRARVAAAAGLP